MRCAPTMVSCKPSSTAGASGLAALVRSYRMQHRPGSLDELEFFRDMPSLRTAVRHAGLATNRRGKRFGHQRRLSQGVLQSATEILSRRLSRLRRCKSFHELHSLVSTEL